MKLSSKTLMDVVKLDLYIFSYSLVYYDGASLCQSGKWLGTVSEVKYKLSTHQLSKRRLIEFLQKNAKVLRTVDFNVKIKLLELTMT